MALSDFINYSSGSDLLAKRLAQQIGQANQEQALRQNQMQAALQQQLAPLQQQQAALNVQALQQRMDPVYRAEQRALELQDSLVRIAAEGDARRKLTGRTLVDKFTGADGRQFGVYSDNLDQAFPITVGGEPIPMQIPSQAIPEMNIPNIAEPGPMTLGTPRPSIADALSGAIAPAVRAPEPAFSVPRASPALNAPGSQLRVKQTGTTGKQEMVRSLTNPKDIRLASIEVGQGAPEGYELLSSADKGLKPSELLAEKNSLKDSSEKMMRASSLFDDGQTSGSESLMEILDASLEAVGGNFEKLNATAQKNLIYVMSKFRDKTSAVLLSEAKQIADAAPLADRIELFIKNTTEGDQIPVQVGKDIYNLISSVNNKRRERYFAELPDLEASAAVNGIKLSDLLVPKKFRDEYEVRKKIATDDVGREALQWLQKNPNDANAPGVRKKLGL